MNDWRRGATTVVGAGRAGGLTPPSRLPLNAPRQTERPLTHQSIQAADWFRT